MPQTITLPDGYGYVALIALGLTPILSFVQGIVVTSFRKAAGVPYPNAYATPQQMKATPAAYHFNCAQRAHANLLENMPQTILSMLFSGLVHPRAATWLGGFWLACRVLYALGYVKGSGDDEKGKGKGRMIGGGFWLAQFALIGLSIYVAVGLF
ncbi:glutathione S-transferase [Exophiala aquamarina CBS 119918]|uniref:Glutathione S-transferase n=1 Tax=Exophiala aquamarina CBS 119918 TaxID=1182545 RepID=A0A072PWK2_9EURO|nr:glutathione S-transferase [Exophiala aquamarina CBS 119918]KEF59970.1 glutathione S-transferase [Exophiala aquamarina CBS 119918]